MRLECGAILFDLDGVLVDSRACVERHWREWAVAHDLDPEGVTRVAHGQRTVDTIRRFAPGPQAETEAARFSRAEAEDLEGVYPVPAAADLLESLPRRSWAVVTSGSKALALARLRHAGLPVPPILVTADDVSRGKPAPDPYLLAAAGLKVNPDRCLVIEDSPAGIESARAAGIRVIGLTTTHDRSDLAGSVALADGLESFRVAARRGREDPILIEID